KTKESSNLFCLMGRRRIGKSTLIQEFSKGFKNFFEIQGLGPDSHPSLQVQLDHFASVISLKFNSRKEHFEDWSEAFYALAKLTKKKEWLILLDEISWMSQGDLHFALKLKEVWDVAFKKNERLFLVLCGSVSSWIEDNILNNASFEGRISGQLNLGPLDIVEINQFWEKRHCHYSAMEKIFLLAITGGVPKYLEEINYRLPVESNLHSLCFSKNGFLFNEYKKIFLDLFKRKGPILDKIIRLCLTQKLSMADLSRKLKKRQDGDISRYVHILELSGFLSKDYSFRPSGEAMRSAHLRVTDNYLRFYIKCIEPLSLRIEKASLQITSLHQWPNFESILGYQLENLVHFNKASIHQQLHLTPQQILSSAPYFQNKSSENRGSCQIDLLIHTTMDLFFLCEIKSGELDKKVIAQIKQKMDRLKLPARMALRPVLIHLADIPSSLLSEYRRFFYQTVAFQQLLTEKGHHATPAMPHVPGAF
ncbi:MAG: AAA family ATPase, partial [Oligoflexia bacterium]|nr:AAA family ATPase [Oligoflexia bacterium]